jgi:membrane-bound lytic murein transglycosylase D
MQMKSNHIAVKVAVFLAVLALLATPAGQAQDDIDLEGLLDAGTQWVEQNVPAEVLNQIQLPTRAEWDEFWTGIQNVLTNGSLEDLAEWQPYVEVGAKLSLRTPGGEDYAVWIQQRLDYFEVASAAIRAVPDPKPSVPVARLPAPPLVGRVWIQPPPKQASPAPVSSAVQLQRETVAGSAQIWQKKLAHRPPPGNSRDLIPRLKKVFREEGVPTELVWLAEVESSLNPDARNPGGAVGMFQFMPATAKRFGLRTSPFDERKNPEKSARAAARYLKFLYGEFKSWPLALAAYNAGEGRIKEVLAEHKGDTFNDIAPRLPLETRLYVPKVAAVIRLREGVSDLKRLASQGQPVD